jgi:hypothetical protein
MEADITFRHLLQRWPDLRLVDGEARRNGNAALRGLSALPLSVAALPALAKQDRAVAAEPAGCGAML